MGPEFLPLCLTEYDVLGSGTPVGSEGRDDMLRVQAEWKVPASATRVEASARAVVKRGRMTLEECYPANHPIRQSLDDAKRDLKYTVLQRENQREDAETSDGEEGHLLVGGLGRPKGSSPSRVQVFGVGAGVTPTQDVPEGRSEV